MKVDISIAFTTRRAPLPPEAVAELIVHGDLREVSEHEARKVGHQLAEGEHGYRFSRLAKVSSVKLGIDQMIFSIDRIVEDNGLKTDEIVIERVFANVVSR